MSPGTLVTAKHSPTLGLGVIHWVLGDRALVSFETDNGYFLDEFALAELELANPAT